VQNHQRHPGEKHALDTADEGEKNELDRIDILYLYTNQLILIDSTI